MRPSPRGRPARARRTGGGGTGCGAGRSHARPRSCRRARAPPRRPAAAIGSSLATSRGSARSRNGRACNWPWPACASIVQLTSWALRMFWSRWRNSTSTSGGTATSSKSGTGRARPRIRIKSGSRIRRSPTSRSQSARRKTCDRLRHEPPGPGDPVREMVDLAGDQVGVVPREFDDQDGLGRLGDPLAKRRSRVADQADRPPVVEVADRRSGVETVEHRRRGIADPAERQDRHPLRRGNRHGS